MDVESGLESMDACEFGCTICGAAGPDVAEVDVYVGVGTCVCRRRVFIRKAVLRRTVISESNHRYRLVY